jgi:hypothetical protein
VWRFKGTRYLHVHGRDGRRIKMDVASSSDIFVSIYRATCDIYISVRHMNFVNREQKLTYLCLRICIVIFLKFIMVRGQAVVYLIEALRYKPNPDKVNGFFN